MHPVTFISFQLVAVLSPNKTSLLPPVVYPFRYKGKARTRRKLLRQDLFLHKTRCLQPFPSFLESIDRSTAATSGFAIEIPQGAEKK